MTAHQSPDRTHSPAITGFGPLTMPSFSHMTLPNGAVLYWLDGCEEDVSRITLYWDAGYYDTPRMATLNVMEDMFTEGCAGRTAAEVTDTLESCGAWFRASAAPHYMACSLQGINKTADVILPLLRDMITSPEFPEESLDSIRQKRAAAREIRDRKPSIQAALLSRQACYGSDSILARNVTPDDYRATDRRELVDVHRNLILSRPPAIFISGKIDSRLLDKVKSVFGSIPFITDSSAIITRMAISCPELTRSVMVTKEMPGSMQTGVRIQIPTITRDHPDYGMLRVATAALGGYFGSRLMSNIREDKGYTYGISASLSTTPDTSNIIIACECDNRYTAPLLQEIDKEIARMAAEELSHEELETVRNVMMSAAASMLDSPFTIASYAGQIAVDALPADSFAIRCRETLSATAAGIRRAVGQYILGMPRVTVLAGNKPC